jgi:copper chaperone CopZ
MAAVKVTARLENLSCPSCADMITSVVSKIKGVEEAEVRYTTSKLLVTYDDEVASWEEIEEKVTKLGYGVIGKKRRD